MEVIILSSEGSKWDNNLFEFINLDFDTQLIKPSQFEDLMEIIDKPVIIVCNVDTYLELQDIFAEIMPINVLVVIDNVYFDPYDPRFEVNPKINLPLSVYGNVNNIIKPQIFRTATFYDVTPDSEDFLEDVKKEIKIAGDIFKEKEEPAPKIINNVKVFDARSNSSSNVRAVHKVKVRGIFSNSKVNLSYLQKLSTK